MNMNRETAINMYYEYTVRKLTLFTKSLSDEISNDENIREYIDCKTTNVHDDDSDDRVYESETFNKLITNEYEKLCNLSNNELNKLSNSIISQRINEQIDDICSKYNKMFLNDKITRRFIRGTDSITIIKVCEEVKDNIWNVISPWSQKYCVSVAYLNGINLKDIETEFSYYPSYETINYITGEPIDCAVFPRTSLSKILKVINGILITKMILSNKILTQKPTKQNYPQNNPNQIQPVVKQDVKPNVKQNVKSNVKPNVKPNVKQNVRQNNQQSYR